MRAILILFTLFVFGTCFSQVKFKETVARDPRTKIKKIPKNLNYINFEQIGEYYYGIFSKSKHEFYLFLWQPIKFPVKYDFVVVKYDKEFNVVEFKTINSSIEQKTKITADIKRVGNDLCAFYYFNNLKTNKQYLFAQKIDKDILEVTGSAIKIAEAPIDAHYLYEPNFFEFKSSQDYSKLLITLDFETNYKRKFNLYNTKKKKRSSVYWLFDSDLNILDYRKDLNISKSSQSTLVDYQVDNKGNVILLGFEYYKDKVSKRKFSSLDIAFQNLIFYARIISLEGNDQTLQMANGYRLLDGKLIYNHHLQRLAFVGLKATKETGSNGLFIQYYNIDSFKLIKENEFDFEPDFINQVETNLKKIKKTNKKETQEEPINYIKYLSRVGECFYTKENELYISTQKYYFETSDINKKTQTVNVLAVCHSDIIAFKFDSLYNYESFCTMPYLKKDEITTNTNYDGIFKNGEFYIITTSSYSKMDFNTNKAKVKNLKTYLINYSLNYKYKFDTNCIVIIYPVKNSTRFFTRYELH